MPIRLASSKPCRTKWQCAPRHINMSTLLQSRQTTRCWCWFEPGLVWFTCRHLGGICLNVMVRKSCDTASSEGFP
eukprot:12927534-Prorocentrum_lima.AAC.1